MAFTGISSSGLHKSLKERDIHNSINGKSIPDFRFPDIYYYLVRKYGYYEDFLLSYRSLGVFAYFLKGKI